MKFTCTAILPYYKEGDIALEVVQGVLAISSVTEVIFVDDGSDDGIADKVKHQFSQVKVIQLSKNCGKTEAVTAGLEVATGDYILLIDTDLPEFDSQSYQKGLEHAQKDPLIDLIIFLRHGDRPWLKLVRLHIILTGERLSKRADLEQVLRTHPTGYQLEIAMNKYMMEHKKQVYSLQTSSKMIYKSDKYEKYGEEGQKIDDAAIETVKAYAGILELWKQELLFCWKKLP